MMLEIKLRTASAIAAKIAGIVTQEALIRGEIAVALLESMSLQALQGSGCMQPTGNADRVFRPKVFLVAHPVPAQGLASCITPITALAFALVDREGKIFDECARRLPPNVVHETNDFVMTLVKAQVALPHRTSVIKSATSLKA
ncbi:hypothetical protein FRACYDRAFT_244959 [Fragilariopsis cylindrus CCMP1102]|uniref:Uncharacterized protein n=1 Tax=Fragilariopsis cylindrus CCMP1102 TaxID=635003 RepID=A0A1E7F144_9STRA|nr:hypothetical protein FRACYDRAFT_244959 [Fragilariopsis cylindrus CCMP1102]|eukprot:OEU11839.1 hypothetical protein FRACYDRAFT_244959 [Fragilariopsis cylindrus CCMP1102]